MVKSTNQCLQWYIFIEQYFKQSHMNQLFYVSNKTM